MSRKEKLSAEGKVKIVRRCLAGEIGLSEAGRLVSVDTETIRGWVARYAGEGTEGLLTYERNRAYNREVKLSAVGDYLSGEGWAEQVWRIGVGNEKKNRRCGQNWRKRRLRSSS